MTGSHSITAEALRPRLMLAVIVILTGLSFISAQPGAAQVNYYVVAEAGSPPLSPPPCLYCDPPRICVPFALGSEEPQPISRSPLEAYGACSDGVGYFAIRDEGAIEFYAQTDPSFEIEMAVGTNISYILAPYQIEVPCDSGTLGFPTPVVSPCRLQSVRLTDSSSFWSYEDASGNIQFTLTGDAPTTRLPEPGFSLGLGVASIAFLFVGFGRAHKSHEWSPSFSPRMEMA